MYRAISNFMRGIRQGLGSSLLRDKQKQDWINGIEIIKVEPYKAGTKLKKKKPVAQRNIKNKLYEDSKLLGDKVHTSENIDPGTKQNEKQPDVLRPAKKKKKGRPLLSKDKNLTALLLNTVPGRTCPKCCKSFRGFNRDDKGGMTTRCCNYKTFTQR